MRGALPESAQGDGQVGKGANYYQKLYYHRLGTPQSEDVLVYERPDQKEWGFDGQVTEDGRYLVITVWKGTHRENGVFYTGLGSCAELVPDAASLPQDRVWECGSVGEVVELLNAFDASYGFVGNDGPLFYFKTDLDAPMSRVIAIDVTHPQQTFYLFTGFTTPGTIYRYDVETGESAVFRQPKVGFDPDAYVTRQVFYHSKDGTPVPMFISFKKGLIPTQETPAYLYGYGGFDIPLTPAFSVANLVWMERGGIYAQANLRGGGEYGKAWHEAGMKRNKQNVFDDFIAAAEWLIANGYTSTPRLAVGGGSNGGLLVGACMTQRPDLFGACLIAVGVLDMLRFDKFTIGWAWTSDFGSPGDAEEFKALLAYSPYHNLRPGTAYPATLITTGDHDDRVFPAHSFKFAAALQAAQAGSAPAVIRIETRAGHGAGKPTSKVIEEAADRWAFVIRALGVG